MRKLLTVALAAAAALGCVAAVGVVADVGAAIYAENHWSQSVRTANRLGFDPWVSILGFPFAPQAAAREYRQVEIRAGGVEHPVVGRASLEATLYAVDLDQSGWLAGPRARLPVGRLESRIIVDSTHVGRFIGVQDLLVEAPARETNTPTGGTTASGISSGTGLVFTGTPVAAGWHKRVSVSVDVAMVAGPDDAARGGLPTTLTFTPTEVLTGAGTADIEVPADQRADVLDAFRASMPDMVLPFAVRPTSVGARGSDVIIEGIAKGLTVPLDRLREP